MKLRFSVHAIRVDIPPNTTGPRYRNVGVWVQAGKRLFIEYLPGNPELAERGRQILSQVDGAAEPDFLDYWHGTTNPYQGSFTAPVETERYNSPEAAVSDLTGRIKSGKEIPSR